MDIDITSEVENKLLNRKELIISIDYEGATPPRKEIREAIGRKIGVNPELVAVRNITNEYGKQTIRIEAHAYSKKELYQKYEPEYIRARYEAKKKEAKAEEKPKEAKKEPAKEEKLAKEEKKKEVKKEEPKKEETKKEEKKPEKKEKKG